MAPESDRPALSIILPTLNEAGGITAALRALQPLAAEVIVVDGGSEDATADIAREFANQVIVAPRGRARQMNAGAALARGDVLLFLHADTRLPVDAEGLVRAAIAAGADWGRFDVRIDGQSPWLPLVAALMNRRSRLTGIATGDQAMFVRRALFMALGGFPDQPLMEDIELSRRLKARARPACLRERVLTSGRRWERHGVLRTVLLMWSLRLRYFFGASPRALAKAYGYASE